MKRELKQLIDKNTSLLKSGKRNFQSLYNIVFNNDGILAESSDGFRITKHSYRDVKIRIERVSAGIYETIGASSSYVGLDMDNCVEWIVSFWAILRSGNKPYLVNTRHPDKLSNSILEALGAKYVISLEPSSLCAETLLYSELDSDTAFDGIFEDEMALSTSATSLKETICFYSGNEISNQVLNVLGFIKKHPEIAATADGQIKQLAFLPFYHIFGFIAVYFWFTFFAQTMVFLTDLSANTIMKTCRRQRVTHVFAVPLLWHTIEKEINKKLSSPKLEKKFRNGIKLCNAIQNVFPHLGMRLSQRIMHTATDELMGDSIRFCISGGSYIRESTLKMINGLGYSLHNGYGMSEIGITSVELRSKPVHLNLGSIGKPFDSVEYRIDDNGILEVKGSSICKRIMRDGKNIDTGSWYSTGDKMEERDGYYYILGREGDVVIGENGENINPDVVEQCFNIPYINNLSVLGLGNGTSEELSVVIEISKFISASKIDEITEAAYKCAETLSSEYAVKKFYLTNDPIMSSSAVKVSRKYLSEAIANGSVTLIPFSEIKSHFGDVAINSELISELKQILAGILGITSQDIDENAHILFDIGATSIEYFSFVSLLAERFSIPSSSCKTTNCYTINDFCNYLERYI